MKTDRPFLTAAWYSVLDGLVQGVLEVIMDVALAAPIAGRLARVGLPPEMLEILELLLQHRHGLHHRGSCIRDGERSLEDLPLVLVALESRR